MSDRVSEPVSVRGLRLAVEVPAVVVTMVMMVHITANAVMRTFFNEPLGNTLEVTQYWYLPIVAFVGFVAAQVRGQHVAADLIYERLPSVTKGYVLATMFVIVAVVSAGFAWFGWQEAVHARDIGKTAGVSDLAAWQPYFLVPIAFGSLTVQFLHAAVRAAVWEVGVSQHPVGSADDGEAFAEPERSVEGRSGR